MSVRPHRHGLLPEHDHEPQPGLPEELPANERVLWQGSPDWRTLAVQAFHVRKLAVYFALLLVWRGAVVWPQAGAAQALWSMGMLLPLAAAAIGLIALVARLSAGGAVYTITNRRVVMRIGIVLTVTFNLPHKRIAAAGLHLHGNGSGDIPLTLGSGDHIAWLHLWPHVRPWKLAHPQPMLRCVPDAARVARVLTEAWAQASGGTAAPLRATVPASPGTAATPQHALQSH